MRKVVIIGGGAAGLSLAIGLKKQGQSVKIFEKREENHSNGLALLLLPNGMEVLKKMDLQEEVLKKVSSLNNFVSQYSTGKQIFSKPMSNLYGVKRGDILDTLKDKISKVDISYGHAFSHFSYNQNGEARAVHFKNGHIEKGDVFIGADGVHSPIRKSIFPESNLIQTNISEMVSLIKAPNLVKRLNGTFQKIICKAGGRAIGLLPCSKEDVVWFFQYDESIIDFDPDNDNDIKSFLRHQIGSWANPAEELFLKTDFSHSYLWKTHDMNLLPAFHKNNVALIGDAAHVFNTLTSQGLNSALEDGYCLSQLFSNENKNIPASKVFEIFYSLRKETVKNNIEYGRMLKDQFIVTQDQNMVVPMAV